MKKFSLEEKSLNFKTPLGLFSGFSVSFRQMSYSATQVQSDSEKTTKTTAQEFKGALGLTVESSILLTSPPRYCIGVVFHVKHRYSRDRLDGEGKYRKA